MKIKIIDKGGYCFGGTLKLPVVVDATFNGRIYGVKGSDLIKHGADPSYIEHGFDYVFRRKHVEVVHTVRVVEEAEVRDIDVNITFTDVKQCKAIRQGDQMQCVCGLAWDIDDTDLPECRA